MDPSVWDCLNKPSADGPLLSSCGAELQELMRQIDIMVRNKKMEWQAELISTQDCLTLKEQELAHARVLLEQKHHEVGVIKHQLEGYENGQKSVVTQYEAQLNKLKKQMSDLKEAHEKMQKQKNKKAQNSAEKEKEMTEEIEQLNLQLKDKKILAIQHEKEISEWDISKRALQHQIECLEKQKRALASNYERAQLQLSAAQNHLKRSNRMVEERYPAGLTDNIGEICLNASLQRAKEDTILLDFVKSVRERNKVEGTSQSLLLKLEEELANDKELIQRQEKLIAELQAKNRDLSKARHAANGEKYRYQEQSDKAKCKLTVVEEEVAKLQAALSARETALRGSEREVAAQRNKIADLQSALQTKEKIIDAMQVRSPLKSNEDNLRHKVTLLEASLETMAENEKKLREEIRSLEVKLKMSRDEAENLKQILKSTENAKVNDLNEEISQLRVKLREMEAEHSTQLCGIKDDVTKLSSHLHGRDANIERLSGTCAEMELQLRDEAQRREKLNSELQTASAHLNALRIQRKNASRVEELEPGGNTDRSLTEAESQLTDLRQHYGKAVSRLEEENQDLKFQVSHLKEKLHETDHTAKSFTQTDANSAADDTKQCGDGSTTDIVHEYEQRIASLEARLRDIQEPVVSVAPSCSSVVLRSTDGGDSGSVTPRSEVSESCSSGGSCRVDSRTPTPTNTFLRSIGIDPSSVNTPASSFCSLAATESISEQQLQVLLGLTDDGVEDNGVSVIDQYAVDEEKRVYDLESRIEEHIVAMQRAMDAAMAKYTK